MAVNQLKPFSERVPTYDELNWPALQAMKSLGGSAGISEHLSKLIDLFGVPETVAGQLHGTSGRSELEYRLAWARTALRRCGYLENSARGVWSLTEEGENSTEEELKIRIVELRNIDIKKKNKSPKILHLESDISNQTDWKDVLLDILKQR